MSAELELRLLLAVCAILYITGFVQLCIERSSYREAKKELEARQKEQPERHVRREPLFTPCGTPPGLCPHARKQRDLYGGYYWACEDILTRSTGRSAWYTRRSRAGISKTP